MRRSGQERRLDRDRDRDRDPATLLARTLAFSDHTAQDVMTLRARVVSVDRTDGARDGSNLARRTGFPRFSVIDDGIDDVVGVVHMKQAIAFPPERRTVVPVSALQFEALRTPETMKLYSLLAELRARGYHIAGVVDEYGGAAGVATREDEATRWPAHYPRAMRDGERDPYPRNLSTRHHRVLATDSQRGRR